jgi:hypothetical protein
MTTNTGQITKYSTAGEACMFTFVDEEEQLRVIDIGNFFENKTGGRILFTTNEWAKKYSPLVKCPIHVPTRGKTKDEEIGLIFSVRHLMIKEAADE